MQHDYDNTPDDNTHNTNREVHPMAHEEDHTTNNPENTEATKGVLDQLENSLSEDTLMRYINTNTTESNNTDNNTNPEETESETTNTNTNSEPEQHPDTRTLNTHTITINDELHTLPRSINFNGELIPAPRQPSEVAELLLHTLAEHQYHLINWKQQWWLYGPNSNGAYASISPSDERSIFQSWIRNALRGALYASTNGENVHAWSPTNSLINEIIEAMSDYTHLPEHIPSNTWISGIPDDYPQLNAAQPRELYTCENGIIWYPPAHLRDQGQEPIIADHTPEFFTTKRINCAYTPGHEDNWGGGGKPRRWIQFLDESFGNDDDAKRTLQEWFGYVVSGRTDLQKMMLILGPTRSGKGVIAHILTQLLGGKKFIDSLTLQRLNEQFGLSSMLAKSLALIPDARITSGTKNLVQRLLSITGEDIISVNRKNKPEINTQIEARIMVMSNEMPTFRDASLALAKRMLILNMRQSHYGNEDPQLKNKLEGELTGIFHWALEGLARLDANKGEFTIGDDSAELKQDMEDDMSPVQQFVREHCELAPEFRENKEVMYNVWLAWAGDHGVSGIGSKAQFTRELEACGKGIQRSRYRIDGVLTYGYSGVKLKKEYR